MEKVILKKENGIVNRGIKTFQVSQRPYLTKNELFFNGNSIIKENIIHQNRIEEIKSVVSIVQDMIKAISKTQNSYKVIEEALNNLRKVQTREDLLAIVNYLKKEYKINMTLESQNKKDEIKLNIMTEIRRLEDKLSLQLEKNPDLVMSITAKKIIYAYYSNIFSKLKKSTINELHNLKTKGASISTMMNFIGETYQGEFDKNGVQSLAERIFSDTIDYEYENLKSTLCFDCQYGYVNKCPKIADHQKREIGNYDFITDGFQIFTENGELERFVVTGCKNFDKARTSEKTVAEKARDQKVREEFRMAYYGVGSMAEAYQIQADLIKRGEIDRGRGKLPPDRFFPKQLTKKPKKI